MRSVSRRRKEKRWAGGWADFGALSWLAIPLLGILVACATTWSPAEPRSYRRTATVPGASELVGLDECETCHEGDDGPAVVPAYHNDCESCHGSGELHIDSEEVAEIRFPASADCLVCHETGRSTQMAWTTSEHQRTGVMCSDCHELHSREPRHLRAVAPVQDVLLRQANDTTKLCGSCHYEITSRLNLSSHHPIREGMIGCADCHRPHENRRVTLGARTQLCTGCHEDHAGPWIYEHAPAAEDCGYCHVPHGSSSYSLLETSQPGVCISCHTLAEQFVTHEPLASMTRCTDCHEAIHGSYADSHLRR